MFLLLTRLCLSLAELFILAGGVDSFVDRAVYLTGTAVLFANELFFHLAGFLWLADIAFLF
jgi:hypothetical protein